MKKKSSNYNNEISVVEFLNVIINAKIGIILILFISIIIGIYYNSQNSNSFRYSLIIGSSKDSEFTRFLPIYNLVYEDLLNPEEYQETDDKIKIIAKPNEISEIMLERFADELLDYEELISIFSNIKRIKESISRLPSKQQNQALYNYASLLTLQLPDLKDPSKYILNFVWDDFDEGRDILNNLLKLTSENFEKRIFQELDDLLEIKRVNKLNADLVRIEFLTEQSLIAKELGIKSKDDSLKLSDSNVSFNINIQNVAYYLRGYTMINKEIDLIKSRKYIEIDNMERDIKSLRGTKVNWTDYNINYLEVSKTGRPILILMISIGLGLIVALFYASIIRILKIANTSRKKIG